MSFAHAGQWAGTLEPNVVYQVFEDGTDDPATLYSDADMDTETGSSVAADRYGEVVLFAQPGTYQVLPFSSPVNVERLTIVVAVNPLDVGSGGGTVTSVNGDPGPAVVLDAADVGADDAGSAAAAQAAAEAASDPVGTAAALVPIPITGTPAIGDIATATSPTAAHWAPPVGGSGITSINGQTGPSVDPLLAQTHFIASASGTAALPSPATAQTTLAFITGDVVFDLPAAVDGTQLRIYTINPSGHAISFAPNGSDSLTWIGTSNIATAPVSADEGQRWDFDAVNTGSLGWGATMIVTPVPLSRAIYPVYPGGPYATIAAAIAQAVTDGHTTLDNSALILISPKSGAWTENIILSAGINVQGLGGWDNYAVQIKGKISYTPGVGGTNEKCSVTNLYVISQTGSPAVELVGTNPGQLWIADCVLDKTEATAPCVSMNGASTSVLHVTDCIGNVSSGATAWSVLAGTCLPTRCDLSSTTCGLAANVTGTFTAVQTNLVANGSQVVQVNAGGVAEITYSAITQETTNNSGINIASTGTAVVVYTLITVPTSATTGYCFLGTGVLEYGSNVFAANARVRTTLAATVPLAIVPTPSA